MKRMRSRGQTCTVQLVQCHMKHSGLREIALISLLCERNHFKSMLNGNFEPTLISQIFIFCWGCESWLLILN